MKKIILGINAFILGCMILIAGIPAERVAAAYGSEAGTVTINGVTTGDTLKGYKIITITYNSTDQSVNYEWASDAVKNAVKSKNNNQELTVKEFSQKTAAERQSLLSEITKALGSANADLAEQTEKNGTVSWNSVPLGGYLIIPAKTKDVYEPMMAVVQPVKNDTGYVTQNATVTAKKNPDEETVHTYKLAIVKIKKGDSATKLPGAQFDLYRKVNNGETYDQSQTFTNQTVPALPAGEVFIKIGSVGPTGTNGEASIEKLVLGSYCLVETKAPAGYGLMADGLVFNLAEGGDTNGTYTLQVENVEGFNLPQTGGTGTVLFTAAGIALMAGAVVLFFIVKKKGNIDNKNR